MLDVIGIGTLNVDLIMIGEAPQDFGLLREWSGPSLVRLAAAGSIGYCAYDMARLGLKVGLLAHVADDAFAGHVVSELRAAGVETEHVRVEPGTVSGIGIYMLLFGSRKRPRTARPATHASWPLELTPEQLRYLAGARLLHCGDYLHFPQGWGAPTAEIYRQAKRAGLMTSLDTQFPLTPMDKPWMRAFGELLSYVDMVFADEHEAASVTGEDDPEEAARMLLDQGPRTVVVKRGEEGCLAMTAREVILQPAFSTQEVTDSIGAGDAFDAGFIYGTLQGWDLGKTAGFASAVAALTLRGVGGTETAPTRREVDSFLRLNYYAGQGYAARSRQEGGKSP